MKFLHAGIALAALFCRTEAGAQPSPAKPVRALLAAARGGNTPAYRVLGPAESARIKDGGAFCDGAYHPAGANGFTTLAQLRAVYPFATSLDDPVDGLEIQAAWNAAGAGTVVLPAGQCYAPLAGLVYHQGMVAQLRGAGWTTVIIGSRAIAAGNPVVTVENNGGRLDGPIGNLMIAGFDANKTDNSTRTNAGKAYNAMFVPGSRGLSLTTSAYVTYTGLWFRNLDRTLDWSIKPGNNYIITFRDCSFAASNIGVPITAVARSKAGEVEFAQNSFEKIRIENSVIGNNNVGLQVEFGDGREQSIVADVFVVGTSFDYNIVKQAVIIGASGKNVHENRVYLDGDHLETDSATSGTASRIDNAGDLSLVNSELVELGDLPVSMVAPVGFYASTYLQGNHQAPNPFTFIGDKAGGVFPLVFDGGYNQGGTFYATRLGNIASGRRILANNVVTQPYRLQDDDNHDGQHLTVTAGGGPITVPADTAGPFVMLNTKITVTCLLMASPCSFMAGAGVTITSSGAGLTFGGGKPAEVSLIKIGPNAWAATGAMN